VDTDTWLWILAWMLAAISLGTGLLKLTTTRERMVAAGLTWAGDLSQANLRLIGVVEVLAAIGLVLPPLLGVVPVLAPVCALVIGAVTVVETVVHVRRGELLPDALRSLAVVVLAVLLAAYRFGPQAF
jgi:hypothetical protein